MSYGDRCYERVLRIPANVNSSFNLYQTGFPTTDLGAVTYHLLYRIHYTNNSRCEQCYQAYLRK